MIDKIAKVKNKEEYKKEQIPDQVKEKNQEFEEDKKYDEKR